MSPTTRGTSGAKSGDAASAKTSGAAGAKTSAASAQGQGAPARETLCLAQDPASDALLARDPFALLTGLMDELGTGSPLVTGLLDFSTSPLSGVLLGMAGPFLSPVVELGNSIQTVVGDLTGDAADPSAALQALIATPANVIGSFFNGATLNLDALIPFIEQTGLVPPDLLSIDSLGLNLGGLLTAGGTGGALFEDPTGIGGSIFNALSISALGLSFDGQAVGPLGALVNLSEIIAETLGWDGAGNPLADLAFPTIDWLTQGTGDVSAALAGSGVETLFDSLGGDLATLFGADLLANLLTVF